MPAPIAVHLAPHDPSWAAQAEEEAVRVRQAIGPTMLRIHHIGSTAIPGIVAKPILDLLGVAVNLAALDEARSTLERLGYDWHGEYGMPGRRYCTLTDSQTGKRRAQLHCYADGDHAIDRHLAFRDHLRARDDLARGYAAEKACCAALHPADSHAYTDCKSAWIRRVEAQALQLHAVRRSTPTR